MRGIMVSIRRRIAARHRRNDAIPIAAQRLLASMPQDEALETARQNGQESPDHTIFWRLVAKEIARQAERDER